MSMKTDGTGRTLKAFSRWSRISLHRNYDELKVTERGEDALKLLQNCAFFKRSHFGWQTERNTWKGANYDIISSMQTVLDSPPLTFSLWVRNDKSQDKFLRNPNYYPYSSVKFQQNNLCSIKTAEMDLAEMAVQYRKLEGYGGYCLADSMKKKSII